MQRELVDRGAMPAARCAAVLAATRPTVAYGLITAIYAINKYAETSTACSNTLSEVEFVRCSFAMLVSYMPLAVYFRAQNKSPTAHASATVNDASRDELHSRRRSQRYEPHRTRQSDQSSSET